MAATAWDYFGLCDTTLDQKYRIDRVVGEGGFGVVYHAIHLGFGSDVAIKCLKLPPYLDDEARDELVSKLREEGRLLRLLSQKTSSIVQAHDIGVFEMAGARGARTKVPYLVLEWLEGQPLNAARQKPLPLQEAIQLLASAARALSVAHAANVAHRDIKPENLFLVGSLATPTLKVLDFGIAKVFAAAPSAAEAQTGDGPRAFTPAYGAPEQFDQRLGATGPWTDVYALALVLVELTSGRRAQLADDFSSLLRIVMDPQRRPSLRALGVAAPAEIENVVLRALAIDPRARYSGAGPFWDELEAAVANVSSDALAGTVAARPSAPGFTERLPSAATPPPNSQPMVTGPGLSSTARASLPAPPRLQALRALGVLLAVGVVAWLLFGRGKLEPKLGGGPGGTPTSSGGGVAVKPSNNPQAQALFNDGLQAWFDGSPEVAVPALEQAARLDPSFGAAELRLALWTFERKPTEARAHYQSALLHRSSLSAKDQGLLAACQPYLRAPWDLADWSRRLDALLQTFPGDAEISLYAGISRHMQLRFDDAVAAFDATLKQDSSLIGAWIRKAESLAMKGDVDAEQAAYEACLKVAPAATQCLSRRVGLAGRTGSCGAMLDGAKQLLAMTPNSATTQRQLAVALLATGAPRDSVMDVLSRFWALLPADDRGAREKSDQAALAILDGDFRAAEQAFSSWAESARIKTTQGEQAAPAIGLAELYLEMGELKKAGGVADGFIRRMSALSEPSSGDWTMAFLPYRLAAGSIGAAEYQRERAAWIEGLRKKWQEGGQRLDQEFEWSVWLDGYGGVVRTEADAREALEKMPLEPAITLRAARGGELDFALGRAQALAGSSAAALAPLERSARSCLALKDPLLPASAQLYLGIAREKAGDTAGAREAYQNVLGRWGKAKPRSTTADQAKARLAALPAKR